MKEAYYFSHDANARNDEKILMLRAEHGMLGYGVYWALIESMFENEDTSLRHDKIKGFAMTFNTDITLLQNVINTCISENLFTSDGETFWSESLLRRKDKYQQTKKSRSEAGKKGMAKRWESIENTGTDNSVITKHNSVITKDNKGKEIKEKERKGNEIENKQKDNTAEADLLFESLWKLYPNKTGKSSIKNTTKKNLLKIGFDTLSLCIDRYKKDLEVNTWKHAMNGSTFFNGRYMDYMDGNYEGVKNHGRSEKHGNGITDEYRNEWASIGLEAGNM